MRKVFVRAADNTRRRQITKAVKIPVTNNRRLTQRRIRHSVWQNGPPFLFLYFSFFFFVVFCFLFSGLRVQRCRGDQMFVELAFWLLQRLVLCSARLVPPFFIVFGGNWQLLVCAWCECVQKCIVWRMCVSVSKQLRLHSMWRHNTVAAYCSSNCGQNTSQHTYIRHFDKYVHMSSQCAR